MATAAHHGDTETSTPVPRRKPSILVADDQPHILDALELLLEPEGFRMEKARSPFMVLEALKSGTYDALLIDPRHNLRPGRSGPAHPDQVP
jgi:PleD family two-component response regulator